MFHHEWAAGVTLTRVLKDGVTPLSPLPAPAHLAAMEVARAHHLVINYHIDSLLSVPLLALTVVNHWDVNNLKETDQLKQAKFHCFNALWFNRVTGSEKGVAQLLAHKVFSSTTLGF